MISPAILAAILCGQLTWAHQLPVVSPTVRDGFAATYDVGRERLVLFGGMTLPDAAGVSTALADTWEWDGCEWTRQSPATNPSPRGWHAMTYDSDRRRVLLFGGRDTVRDLADTWEWDGENWAPVDVDARPPARLEHSLTYDPARRRMVLFGGSQMRITTLDDTWEWDGIGWRRQQPATRPGPRRGAAAAFDPSRGRVVIHGGWFPDWGSLADTWEWNGIDWTRIDSGANGFFPSAFGAMAHDPRLGLLVHGGGVVFGNPYFPSLPSPQFVTITLDGRALKVPEWGETPTPQYGCALAYDVARRQLVLVGLGRPEWNDVSAIETWTLETAVEVHAIVPARGSERGGDLVRLSGLGIGGDAVRTVTFGGVDAAAVETGCTGVRVLTPPGMGTGDVVVTTSGGTVTVSEGFTWVPAELAAREGNVNVGRGDRENVLLVSGNVGDLERRLFVRVGDPLWVYMRAPSSRDTSRFALWVWNGAPDATTLTSLPRGVGDLVFPLPALATFNNLGHPRSLGAAKAPSSPAPCDVLRRVRGVRSPMTLTFQGLVEDAGSRTAADVSVTNAVVLRIVR
ncbi:MAG: hypothetical protein HYR85_04400 [Planctomycetes bacterium]|nr:hypothetical protein [Planctomycetota bacterium]